jgi:hypothetical protein
MKSVERRFRDMERKHPGRGSIINFNAAVRGMKLSRARLARWFLKLVDPNDYDKSERRQILDYAHTLSWSEAYAKTPKFRVRAPRNTRRDPKIKVRAETKTSPVFVDPTETISALIGACII